MLAQKITFDLMQNKLDDIRVVQGDSCREIQFEGSDLDGVLSYEDYTYEFDLMKSDGTFVIQTLSAGVLIPSEQMEVITGTHYYSVKIKDADNELVYSGQGAFIVDDNVITEEAIESAAEVNGLVFPDDFLTVNDNVAFIDDDTVSEDSTWSSDKIQEEIDQHVPVISKTISGNPITFDDGASAPLVKCVTEIQGSQDLHGYDKPWVGGVGKNKYGNGDKTFVQAMQNIVLDTPLPAGTYTFSAIVTSTDTDNYDCLIQFISGSAIAASGRIWRSTSNNIVSLSFTWSEGTVDKLNLYAAASYANGAGDTASFTDIQIESGSTATAYEPYSNICPITAYTEGEIVERGKNLFSNTLYKDNYGINSSGSEYASSSYYIAVENLSPSENYVISLTYNGSSTSQALRVQYYDSDDNVLSMDSVTLLVGARTVLAFTTPASTAYAHISINKQITDMQIELGSTATDYEPYTSTTHTATYPSAIYRGSEDCVKVEVKTAYEVNKLTSVSQLSGFGTSAEYGSYAKFQVTHPIAENVATSLCSHCRVVAYDDRVANPNEFRAYEQNGNITIRASAQANVQTVNELFAYFQDAEFVFPLATPTTSSVTTTNLPIKSLSGYNHIESSTGDMEVEYITSEYQPLVDLIEESGYHTYSTSEQVVGKWINGSDMYEITYVHSTDNYINGENIYYNLPSGSVCINIEPNYCKYLYQGGWYRNSGTDITGCFHVTTDPDTADNPGRIRLSYNIGASLNGSSCESSFTVHYIKEV